MNTKVPADRAMSTAWTTKEVAPAQESTDRKTIAWVRSSISVLAKQNEDLVQLELVMILQRIVNQETVITRYKRTLTFPF